LYEYLASAYGYKYPYGKGRPTAGLGGRTITLLAIEPPVVRLVPT
jgi:hypothetical protein